MSLRTRLFILLFAIPNAVLSTPQSFFRFNGDLDSPEPMCYHNGHVNTGKCITKRSPSLLLSGAWHLQLLVVADSSMAEKYDDGDDLSAHVMAIMADVARIYRCEQDL